MRRGKVKGGGQEGEFDIKRNRFNPNAHTTHSYSIGAVCLCVFALRDIVDGHYAIYIYTIVELINIP